MIDQDDWCFLSTKQFIFISRLTIQQTHGCSLAEQPFCVKYVIPPGRYERRTSRDADLLCWAPKTIPNNITGTRFVTMNVLASHALRCAATAACLVALVDLALPQTAEVATPFEELDGHWRGPASD